MGIRVETDLSQVRNRLERVKGQLVQKRREYVRELARRLMQQIIDRTPVETGRARSGWNQDIGEEVEEGETTRISVTNEVEYINFLEFGTSKMQAAAMVRSSLNQSRREVDSISLNVFE